MTHRTVFHANSHLLPSVPTSTQMASDFSAQATEILAIARDYRLAQTAVPDGWPTYIRTFEEAGVVHTKVRFRLPGEWHLNGRTSVIINNSTGELVISERSDESSATRRLVNQLYPLHSGYGMHFGYRLLILIAGIALAWLAFTGGSHYYTRWLHRRKRRWYHPD
ncbi:hypothetical protein [Haliea alexandrii]|uniref:hypothetical protein n=1 Tax=Haliea alexandrii TaxID=2448162 RepID=UPI001304EBC9|nr:hypothetical protein [Haliea alexandrii]